MTGSIIAIQLKWKYPVSDQYYYVAPSSDNTCRTSDIVAHSHSDNHSIWFELRHCMNLIELWHHLQLDIQFETIAEIYFPRSIFGMQISFSPKKLPFCFSILFVVVYKWSRFIDDLTAVIFEWLKISHVSNSISYYTFRHRRNLSTDLNDMFISNCVCLLLQINKTHKTFFSRLFQLY